MKYKRIRSAAHNFAHSFVSSSNHVGGDYVIGHLARAAVAAREPELRVDLMTGDAEPEALLVEPVRVSIHGYVQSFPRHLHSQDVAIDAVRTATMRVRFDLSALDGPEPCHGVMLPYECVVDVTDDRGGLHVGAVRDEWPLP